jgi:phosphoglycolate phosphatase
LDELDTKAGLIARALSVANVTSNEAIMLGDRHYDITGALENKILPVGALWGYGSYDELYAAGCGHFAKSPNEFQVTFVERSNAALTEARRSIA